MGLERLSGRLWLVLGAVNGFCSVALGAFAAHGLRGRLSEPLLAVFGKAVDYQGLHALALLAVGALLVLRPQARLLHGAGLAFFLGILLFSGSLYLLALTGDRTLGWITPFGGTAFLLGWGLLALAAGRLKPQDA